MKKLILYLLFILLMLSFIFNETTIISSKNALLLWSNTLVPTFLFPLLFIRLLIPYHLLLPLLKPFKKIFYFLFHIDIYGMEMILTSLLLGFPGSSIFLEEQALKQHLSKQAYHRFICAIFMASPGFILLSLSVVYPSWMTHRLLYVQLCSIFSMLLLTRRIPIQMNTSLAFPAFFTQMKTSMQTTMQILLTILAYLLIIYVVIDLISLFLNDAIKTPLKLLSEFSSGCFLAAHMSIPILYRMLLTSILLSYGGLCVHMQLISSLHENFHYPIFIRYRLLHILLSIIFTYLFFCYI